LKKSGKKPAITVVAKALLAQSYKAHEAIERFSFISKIPCVEFFRIYNRQNQVTKLLSADKSDFTENEKKEYIACRFESFYTFFKF
jgi:hypothetical protein